jgi:hypothetical protein
VKRALVSHRTGDDLTREADVPRAREVDGTEVAVAVDRSEVHSAEVELAVPLGGDAPPIGAGCLR